MKEENPLRDKSYVFSIRIVKTCLLLQRENNEYVLSKQLLRSGTSIGANIEEAIGAHSKKEFHMKLSISYKEARETEYWLRLLLDCELIERKLGESLKSDCNELLKLLGKIQITLKKEIYTKETS